MTEKSPVPVKLAIKGLKVQRGVAVTGAEASSTATSGGYGSDIFEERRNDHIIGALERNDGVLSVLEAGSINHLIGKIYYPDRGDMTLAELNMGVFGKEKPTGEERLEKARKILDEMGLLRSPSFDPIEGNVRGDGEIGDDPWREIVRRVAVESEISDEREGSTVMPEDALDADGNFDSSRWQRYKKGTLVSAGVGAGLAVSSVVLAGRGAAVAGRGVAVAGKETGKAGKESAKFIGRHRTAQVALAAIATIGIGTAMHPYSEFQSPVEVKLSWLPDVSVKSPIFFDSAGSDDQGEDQVAPGAQAPSGHKIVIPGVFHDPGIAIPDGDGGAGEEAQGLKKKKTSDELTIEEAKRVLDLAGEGNAGDGAFEVKIQVPEDHEWGTFDWSLAASLESVGFRNFNPNNPALNGEQRWEITKLVADSLGVTTDELNLVYKGDIFKIKVTPALAQKFIDLNIEVPRAVLESTGLVSYITEEDDKPAGILASTTTSGGSESGEYVFGNFSDGGGTGDISGGSVADLESLARFTGGSTTLLSVKSEVDSSELIKYRDTTYQAFDIVFVNDVAQIDVQSEELEVRGAFYLPAADAGEMKTARDRGETVLISAVREGEKMSFMYKQANGNWSKVGSEQIPPQAIAALALALEDEEDEDFWTDWLGQMADLFNPKNWDGYQLFYKGAFLLSLPVGILAVKRKRLFTNKKGKPGTGATVPTTA